MIEAMIVAAGYVAYFSSAPGAESVARPLIFVLLLLAALMAIVGKRVKPIMPTASELLLYAVGIVSCAVALVRSVDYSIYYSMYFLTAIICISVIARTLPIERLLDLAAFCMLACAVTTVIVYWRELLTCLSISVGKNGLIRFMPFSSHPLLVGYISARDPILLVRRAYLAHRKWERYAMAAGAVLAWSMVLAASARSAVAGLLAAALFAYVAEFRFFKNSSLGRAGMVAIIAGLVVAAYFAANSRLSAADSGGEFRHAWYRLGRHRPNRPLGERTDVLDLGSHAGRFRRRPSLLGVFRDRISHREFVYHHSARQRRAPRLGPDLVPDARSVQRLAPISRLERQTQRAHPAAVVLRISAGAVLLRPLSRGPRQPHGALHADFLHGLVDASRIRTEPRPSSPRPRINGPARAGVELASTMPSLGVLWSQYGPYHFARISALKSHAASQTIHALEIASRTHDYEWSRSGATVNLITLFPGDVAERLSFWRVFFRTQRASPSSSSMCASFRAIRRNNRSRRSSPQDPWAFVPCS